MIYLRNAHARIVRRIPRMREVAAYGAAEAQHATRLGEHLDFMERAAYVRRTGRHQERYDGSYAPVFDVVVVSTPSPNKGGFVDGTQFRCV